MNLKELQKEIDVTFKDEKLLEQAFIHRSFINEANDATLEHNERLEFLGDAVLELIVTDHLYKEYAEPEGVLTNWRAALVRGVMIATIGEELGFGDLLQLSKGEQGVTGKARGLIMANAFEALTGAIYLDKGYEKASNFIHKFLIVKLGTILEQKLHIDPKSQLQEVLQTTKGITPSYEVLKEEGPDHNKIFTSAVYAGTKELAQGDGLSKQRAEVEAARNALAIINATQ